LLLIGGMLMWFFEREKQEYFDRPASKAVFPAFWWALNLVVNGGFEERIPRSFMGRIFGVLLVISSLFIVSIFVARITAAMTVSAIESSVSSVNDLYGKSVGTVTGSTAELFLDSRDIRAQGYEGFQALVQAFEAKDIDAVVFDSPILAYYVNTDGAKIAELAGPIFQQENYGIALPTGSSLNEPINQSLLKLRENGTYATLYRKWFGETP
jgi:polar amino acid transport system substrate-binding protein